MKDIDTKKKRLITSALPYVNNEPHLGNLIQVLSADAFARFSRLKGYQTFYVCGTDEYGTATETKACEVKTSAYKLCSKYFKLHKSIYDFFNISFDSFSRTSNAQHTEITQEIFRSAYKNGYIIKEKSKQFYCPHCHRFLADRFVTGECPTCGSKATGEQCESCGTLIDSSNLANPKCFTCGNTPELRETENFSLNLPEFSKQISQIVKNAKENNLWSQNSIKSAESWLAQGLKPRSITRDLSWGIKVPLKGYDDKVFYVWFDAPIGYISLTAMKLKKIWKDWWQNNNDVALYHFIGKDNIPFHTIMFPASLIASGLPWTFASRISSTEYLKYEGGKFSKSKGIGVFGSDCITSKIPSDLWRFYLYYNRPEKADSDFSFPQFATLVNSEVVGNFSNLANRTFTFLDKYFSKTLISSEYDFDFYSQVQSKFDKYEAHFEALEERDALKTALEICDMANKYFQKSEPWNLVKINKQICARVMTTLVMVLRDISVLLFPFMPETSAKLLSVIYPQGSYSSNSLGDVNLYSLGKPVQMGLKIGEFSHLFDNLDNEYIESLRLKYSEVGKNSNAASSQESKDIALDFSTNVLLKVAKIESVTKHPDGDKLYILSINAGESENRTIVSSIVPYYKPEELLGHKIVLVSNLKPANFRGVKSFGMLLAASDKNDTEHKTCEVIFADEFEVGCVLSPQGFPSTVKSDFVVKADKFFTYPLQTIDGNVCLLGIKIVNNSGKCPRVYKYINGNVG